MRLVASIEHLEDLDLLRRKSLCELRRALWQRLEAILLRRPLQDQRRGDNGADDDT
jgi:hypothetical protein